MRHLIVLSALVAALAVAGTASAGGWATVGVSSLPTGLGPGDTWNPEIKILQHGMTPLGGLTPVVTIRDSGSGDAQQFIAVETVETGIYEADVVFPSAGEWNVVVDSGFGDSRLTFGPETIADSPGGGGTFESFPVLPLALVALVAALLAAATLGARRRWRPTALPR
ncbi:MAG: hypothetical protein H0U46_05735 [Actinobacteria bacterium]|nr:hypothetical protein [Actinomycetota bacterium]